MPKAALFAIIGLYSTLARNLLLSCNRQRRLQSASWQIELLCVHKPEFVIIREPAADLLARETFEFGQALPVRVVHLVQRCAKQRHGNLCFGRKSELSLDAQQPPLKIS